MRGLAPRAGTICSTGVTANMLASALALGGAVRPAAAPEFGYVDLVPTPLAAGDPVLRGIGAGLPLMEWHEDGLELPEGAVAYKRTPEFDERTMPDGLRRDHTTRAGTWGRLHVVAGRLRYCVDEPVPREQLLDPATPGIIPPEVRHHVEPLAGEPVRFFVEFLRLPGSQSP